MPSPKEPTKSTSKPPLPRSRKIIFILAAALLVPLLALGLLEGGLRLFGYGYPTSFFLEQKEGSTTYLVDNPKFGWRFFPRQIARSPATLKFAKKKEPGTIRIFVLGESAALGDPKPAYSLGRYLEVLLRERFPSAKFEVITAAMTAINSHALLPMARECAELEGDFWILYMGNNEMAGPFGINPLSGPSAPSVSTVRLSLALRTTKLGQLMESITEKARNDDSPQAEWAGMKMFRERSIAPSDPKKQTIYANFQGNLEDILRAAHSHRAKPILCTVASNLRDFAPLASVGSTNGAYAKGVESQRDARFEEAAQSYQSALAGMDSYADLHFRLGQLQLELGGTNEIIRAHFEKARDLDALPLRTDGRMNAIIREFAKASSAPLIDLDREMGTPVAGTTPGDESFFDHVHLNFAGNYRAARLIAQEIEKALPKDLAEKRAVNWASAQICDRALALTDWNRRAAHEQMLRRQMEAPFTDQSNHSNRIENMARVVSDLRQASNARAATNAAAIYQEALVRNENDFRLRESYAEFLEGVAKWSEAAEQRIKISTWVPHDSVAAYHAGRVLVHARRAAEARTYLERALQLRPVFPEAHLEIGRAYSIEAMHVSALKAYDEALKQRTNDATVLIQKAHSYAAMNLRAEMKHVLREAIRLRPESWEPHYLLAVELAADNELQQAIIEFNEVTRLRPGYANAYFNLAVALAKIGRVKDAYRGFQKTVELDPDHKSAREYMAALEREYAK
ncbi:MAG TPA: hypothetical protein VF773_17875 [Verrucomicrobiae bacterium]